LLTIIQYKSSKNIPINIIKSETNIRINIDCKQIIIIDKNYE